MNKKQKNISGYKLEQVPVVLTPTEVSLILQIEEKEVIKLIGNGVIINTSSSVDHDCYLKDFCSLAPGVNIGGNVVIGKRTFLSIGAKVMHGIKIGNDNVVGGSSFVNKNIIFAMLFV